MRPETERQLVKRALEGSLDAFDELMLEHQDRLYRFVLVRGASAADAHDIVQDTFLAAWRSLSGYRPKWRFSTWLYTIARREASRRPREHDELPAGLVDAGHGPAGQTQVDQQRDNLWGVAGRVLNREGFTTLWLYYGEDYTISEVARILGRSVPWVKVTLHRGRKRLADEIDADEAWRKELRA